MTGSRFEIDDCAIYDQIKRSGIEPLIMPELFSFENSTRVAIIKRMFQNQSKQNDLRFYKWVWDIKPHWCENCGKPLQEFSPAFISHIKTRGAHTELRYDPMNTNTLCFDCHNKWEFAPIERKERMYIYQLNKLKGLS